MSRRPTIRFVLALLGGFTFGLAAAWVVIGAFAGPPSIASAAPEGADRIPVAPAPAPTARAAAGRVDGGDENRFRTEAQPADREKDVLVWVDGHPLRYTPASVFVLPGERLHLDLPGNAPGADVVVDDSVGDIQALGGGSWVWTAPTEPGVHSLRVTTGQPRDSVRLRAFVMVPANGIRNGSLNGYRIGSYPTVPLRGDTMYIRPDGFVEVTEANRDLRVSPRFRLRHFETKQGGDFPRYVVLQRKLLTKLELIVDALVDRGYPARSLHVMSGYRTPAYNRGIGNVQYSRHQWGDAADVFVDEDGDGWMDDLTGDGQVNRQDAQILFSIVDSLDSALDSRRLLGGLGIYAANSRRGPFVHVDTRGRVARW